MKTVVILTMPRSGSSLLAAILHRLGVWMGKEEDLNVGKHLNKYGCYENQSLIALNENLFFQSKRLVDHSRRLIDDDGLFESVVKRNKEKIRDVIRGNERDLWGFKNPTIIYTLPHFCHLLRNPHYIRLYRDPGSAAHSFLRTARPENWWPEIKHEFSYFTFRERIIIAFRFLKLLLKKGNLFRNYGLQKKIAEDGYKRIDRFLKDKRYISIHLDELLHDSEKVIQEIINFLEISPSPEQIRSALNFIRPDLVSN